MDACGVLGDPMASFADKYEGAAGEKVQWGQGTVGRAMGPLLSEVSS